MIKHPQTVAAPTPGFVTGIVSAGMVTQAMVSGHQSIMSGSTSNLLNVHDPKVNGPVHMRNRSDANYAQSNNSGKNYVISSQNQVYPSSSSHGGKHSKKASNLKSMSNNN
jgi:hypothetical protein